MEIDIPDFILSSYKQLLKLNVSDVSRVGDDIPIPFFKAHIVNDLIILVLRNLKKQRTLVFNTSPCVIVGDIHGNLHDLIRILITNNPPSHGVKYIFLGDIVDRGDYSIECLILIYALMAKYPNMVTLIRGNHEFKKVNGFYGFSANVTSRYTEDLQLYERFNDSFGYLPLACVLDNKYFICHGGISQHIKSLNDLVIQKPIVDLQPMLVSDLVWADPTDVELNYSEESSRGKFHDFGRKALHDFLQKYKFKALIRGHQYVDGVKCIWNDTCITVFSSSGYRGPFGCCGYLNINGDSIKGKTLPYMPRIGSKHASFYESKLEASATSLSPYPHCKCFSVSSPNIKPNKIVRSKLKASSTLNVGTLSPILSPHKRQVYCLNNSNYH